MSTIFKGLNLFLVPLVFNCTENFVSKLKTTCDISAKNLCSSLGCEYSCKSSLEGGTCVCPKGMKVANDSRSCVGE